jgi:hypothetical protein
MAFSDLLDAFQDHDDLPVDLDVLAKWIIDKGIQDEIEFIGVELDTGVIRGFLHRYRYQKGVYDEHVNVAHIYYATNQPQEWINLVCCKELIHLMDGNHCVARKDDFDNLIKRLVLPRELHILLQDPTYAKLDKFGDAFASALLLPSAARAQFLPHYDGPLTAADIARIAVMPVQYVRMVMSDSWDSAYELMCKL